jgi:hypothetical protein
MGMAMVQAGMGKPSQYRPEHYHNFIARRLAHKLDWRGTWHGGQLPSGRKVWVCADDRWETSSFSVLDGGRWI